MPELDQIKHYDKLYAAGYDYSRYRDTYELAAKLCEGRVLDCGCGYGQMGKYLMQYKGFDGAAAAVEKSVDKRIYHCNLYDEKCYQDADTYLFLEVLEHVDDLKVLQNVPEGKTIIFSVPSFMCYEHLRTYDAFSLAELPIKISHITRFNWHNRWEKTLPKTNDYILLCKGIKK
jgi:SAM-dependent methyltransferase